MNEGFAVLTVCLQLAMVAVVIFCARKRAQPAVVVVLDASRQEIRSRRRL
jgi:hypothetical protein